MKIFGSEDLAAKRLAERSEEMSDPTVHSEDTSMREEGDPCD